MGLGIRIWIHRFGSQDLDLWICVSGFCTLGLGVGSQDLDLTIWISRFGPQDLYCQVWVSRFGSIGLVLRI